MRGQRRRRVKDDDGGGRSTAMTGEKQQRNDIHTCTYGTAVRQWPTEKIVTVDMRMTSEGSKALSMSTKSDAPVFASSNPAELSRSAGVKVLTQ